MVDLKSFVDVDPKSLGLQESVYYPVLEKILEENDDLDSIKEAIHDSIHELIPKHITKEDIIASINYNMHLGTASEMTTISTIWVTVVSVP